MNESHEDTDIGGEDERAEESPVESPSQTIDTALEAATAELAELGQALQAGAEEQPDPPSRTAVGVSFRRSGKVYYFSTGNVACEVGDRVIAATEKGIDIGEVVEFRPSFDQQDAPPLKPVLRLATAEDIAQENELQAREKEALKVCEEKVAAHNLPMKLIEADYSFDGQRLVVFFGAEGRVDFRALVRDLAETFRCRIELRQIGVRDEAKMIGGYGACGRPLCCTTFLRNFDAVGIKVAKDQGLALNPTKISGVCDRLMCCLKYEHEVYKHLATKLPRTGSTIQTPKGEGIVKHVILLKERVIAEVQGEYIEVNFGEPPAPKPATDDWAAEAEQFETAAVADTDSTRRPQGEARRPRRGERRPKEGEPARRGARPGQGAKPAPPAEAEGAKGERKVVPFVPPKPAGAEAEGEAGEGTGRRRRRPRRRRTGGAEGQQGAPEGAQGESAAPAAGAGPAAAPSARPAAGGSAPQGGEAGAPAEGQQPRQGRRRRRGGRSQGQGEQQAGAGKPTEGGRPAGAERAAEGARPAEAGRPVDAAKPAGGGEGGEGSGRSRRGGRPYYRRRGSRSGGGKEPGGGGSGGGGGAPGE